MTLFRPFRESPDAADFDRDEKRFNDAAEVVDAVVSRGTILREVPQSGGESRDLLAAAAE